MADIDPLIDFVLKLEDSKLEGHTTTTRGDAGGATRFGLASRWHTDLVAAGYFDEGKTPRDTALAIARKVYAEQYAAPLCLADLHQPNIAARLLGFAVNVGVDQAVRLFQVALCVTGHYIFVDGCMGPKTIAAANAAGLPELLEDFRAQMNAFYRRLVAVKPDQISELEGWLDRARA